MSNLAYVVYTDGGSVQNSLYGGYGAYILTVDLDEPVMDESEGIALLGYASKKENHKSIKLTALLKTKPKKYKVIHKKSVWGGIKMGTNNQGESTGMLRALTHLEPELAKGAHVSIITDSRYCTDAISSWVAKWKENGWLNSKLEVPACVDIWKAVDIIYEKYKANIAIGWVRGHVGNIGNEKSDELATRGVALAMEHDHDEKIAEEDVGTPEADALLKERKKKLKNDSAKVLNNHSVYFMSGVKTEITSTGHSVYYLGNHNDKDSKIRIDNPDATIAVAFTAKPDPVIEMVCDQYRKRPTQYPKLVVGKLSTMVSHKVYPLLKEYGEEEVIPVADMDSFNLYTVRDEQLTQIEHAPRASFKYLECLQSMRDRVGKAVDAKFEDKVKGARVIDVTDQFYMKGPKKMEVIESFNASVKVKTILADLKYDPSMEIKSGVKLNKDGLAMVPATVGKSIPALNAFKALATANTKVYLHLNERHSAEYELGMKTRVYDFSLIILTDGMEGDILIWGMPIRNALYLTYGV